MYSEENPEIPDNILEQAAQASANLLPVKSRSRYEHEYQLFTEWRNLNKIKTVSDDILLVYFVEKAKSMKSSTLWSRFSMLKSCLAIKENADINKYPKTIAFLKRQAVGYIPKKSRVLTAEQVTKFLCEAPDEQYLLAKAILVFGIFGACRRDDLIRLNLDDVVDNERFLVVFLRDGKTHTSRSFTITNEGCTFEPCTLYRKYAALRPKNMNSRRLFVAYRNGRCYAQHVGCHTISGVPKIVAEYLKLENPREYTGHGLRRSSASMLVESGGDLLTLKRHGGWRSSNVAEGYIEESIQRKIEVSRKLFNPSHSQNTTSVSFVQENQNICEESASIIAVSQNETPKGLNLCNNTNCTINITINNNNSN